MILKRFLSALTILGVVVLAFGCQTKVRVAKTPPPPVQAAVERADGAIHPNLPTAGLLPSELKGEKIFKDNCATCHGVDGRGKGNPHLDLTHESVMRKKKLMDMFSSITNSAAHKGIPEKVSVLDRWSALMFMRTFYAKAPMGDVEFERTFGRNCATCHGKRGHGDGPLSKTLVPPPANFTSLERMFERSDQEIFDIISKGAYPSAMPPWADVEGMRSPADRWKFVDYVRTLSYKTVKIEKEEE